VVKAIVNRNIGMLYFLSRENAKVSRLNAMIDKKFSYKPTLGLATMTSDRQEYRKYSSYFYEL
jgi:hypothetical protein